MPETPEVNEAIEFVNKKTLGDTAAFYTALSMQDAVQSQREANAMRNAHLGARLSKFVELDPAESIALKQAMTGDAGADRISSLNAALAGAQQGAKVAQTTPPGTSQ